jgi:hypothetical protein
MRELARVEPPESPSPERRRRPPTRLLAGAAFAVYMLGLAAAFGRGAILVVAGTVVVAAVVAAAMRIPRPSLSRPRFARPSFPRPTLPRPPFSRRPTFSRATFSRLALPRPTLPRLAFSRPALPRPTLSRPGYSRPAFAAPSLSPEARQTAARALAVARHAAEEALRALGHGRVRAAAVAADLPKLLPAAPAAPRQVAQLRLDWRLRQAQQLNRSGTEARRAGRAAEAAAAHRRAVEIYREAGDERHEALTLSALALAEAPVDPDGAVGSFEAALEILRRLGDERAEGQVLANLGVVHHRVGRDDAAYRCWADALPRLDPASPEHARLAERLQLAS